MSFLRIMSSSLTSCDLAFSCIFTYTLYFRQPHGQASQTSSTHTPLDFDRFRHFSSRHEGELCLEYATHGAGPTVYPAADPGDFFVRSFTALLLLLLYCYVARQQRCTSVWYFAGPGAFQALFLLPHVVSPSALRR